VADKDSGEVLIDTHVMADLGTIRFFDPDGRVAGDGVRTEYLWVREDGTTSLAEEGNGGRANINALGGYETLQLNFRTIGDRPNLLPFADSGFTIASQGPFTFVKGPDVRVLPDQNVEGWNGGYLDGSAERFTQNEDNRVGATRWLITPGDGLHIRSATTPVGVFHTDLFAGSIGTDLRQFVKPGLDFRISPEEGRLISLDTFDDPYISRRFAGGSNFIDTRRNHNNQIVLPN
jgi:hypothetical protein